MIHDACPVSSVSPLTRAATNTFGWGKRLEQNIPCVSFLCVSRRSVDGGPLVPWFTSEFANRDGRTIVNTLS